MTRILVVGIPSPRGWPTNRALHDRWWVQGRLVELDTGFVTLDLSNGQFSIPTQYIRQMKVSTGPGICRGTMRLTACVAASTAVGALTFRALLGALARPRKDWSVDFPDEPAGGPTVDPRLVMGGALGFATGFSVGRERWKQIPWPQ